MKKIVLSSLLIVLTGLANAQLFVKDGSYMFVTNQYVTVSQEVNLDTSGELFLRNTSQLLQKSSGSSFNAGTGKISLFQEGTANNFQYNYWCSPVGNGAGTGSDAGDNLFGVTLLNRPTGLTSSTAAQLTGGYNGSATGGSGGTMQIANYWIWKFVNLGPNYANWQHVSAATTLNPGEGFTMKGTSGADALDVDADLVDNKVFIADPDGAGPLTETHKQRYDFRGRPNDGTIAINVSSGNRTLVGNPYPSAINLNFYLLENSGYNVNYTTGAYTAGGPKNVITGAAQFWEHSKGANTHNTVGYVGGYGTYVPNGLTALDAGTYTAANWNTYNLNGSLNTTGASSGATYQRRFCPIGQGFFVTGTATGTADMKNVYRLFLREGGTSTFERVSNATSSTLIGTVGTDIPNVAGSDYTLASNDEVPQIRLETVLNNQLTREIVMAFNPNTTDDYDQAMDGLVAGNDANLVYFNQDNNTKKCVISTFAFNINKKIPIAFKNTDAASFKVKVSNMINFTGTDKVYIHDKETDVYYDIVDNAFEMQFPAGENNNRYEITFTDNVVLSNDTDLVAGSFQIFQNNTNQMLSIANTLAKDVITFGLYDVTGKQVMNKKNLGNATQIEIPTNNLSTGVYIVKLNTSENIAVEKKVIISN